MRSPEFTVDWFSEHIPVWREFAPPAESPCRALEIGSYEGRSALWLLEHVLRHPESTITCVDPHRYADGTHFNQRRMNAVHKRFLRNTATYRRTGKLIYHDAPAVEVLPGLSVRYDLIYIDGAHDAPSVLTDSVLSWLRLKSGGLMIWDDYSWQWERGEPVNPEVARPKLAIDAFLQVFMKQCDLLHRDRQVFIRKVAP